MQQKRTVKEKPAAHKTVRKLVKTHKKARKVVKTKHTGRQLLQEPVTNLHFYSTDSQCEQLVIPAEATLVGYISRTRGLDFLRALIRCTDVAGYRNHYSLSDSCPPGQAFDKLLGYVR